MRLSRLLLSIFFTGKVNLTSSFRGWKLNVNFHVYTVRAREKFQFNMHRTSWTKHCIQNLSPLMRWLINRIVKISLIRRMAHKIKKIMSLLELSLLQLSNRYNQLEVRYSESLCAGTATPVSAFDRPVVRTWPLWHQFVRARRRLDMGSKWATEFTRL